jgi:probable rRNA maturation factor
MSPAIQVDVQFATQAAQAPDAAAMQKWLTQTIARAATFGDRELEVSIKVVDEQEGRLLNNQYRAKDYATNVLSFPLLDAAIADLPEGPPVALGDIVVCGPVVAREAKEQGLDSADHWAHMLVHGALHLLGYDHETDLEATQMESLETLILAQGGVADPYAQDKLASAEP